MKKSLTLLCIGIALSALCAQAQSTNNGTASAPKKPPFAGMTRARAAEYYGQPFVQAATADGERWYYRLKFNEVYGRALVPFYFDSPNVHWGSIDFDKNGRAKAFDWRAPLSP